MLYSKLTEEEKKQRDILVDYKLSLVNNSIYCRKDSEVDNILNLVDEEIIGLDTETANRENIPAFDPLRKTAFIRLIQIEADDQIVIFDLKYLNRVSRNKIAEYIKSRKILVVQNAKFDIKWLQVHLGIKIFPQIFCTMLASQTNSGGYIKTGHSLKSQVKDYFNYDLDKSQGASNWGDDLSVAQMRYAATDTPFLRMLRDIHIEKGIELKTLDTMENEFGAIIATAYLELCGIKLNSARWLKIAERNKIRAYRMKILISHFLNKQNTLFQIDETNREPTFEVTTASLKKWMKYNGYTLPTKQDKKKEKYRDRDNGQILERTIMVEKETLQIDYIEKNIERDLEGKPRLPVNQDIWQMLVKHGELDHAHTSFGDKWTNKTHPVTGRIHPDAFQYGTGTGRWAFTNPNLQQIPAINLFRNCIIPEEGNKIISADYNAAELRIIAEASGDKEMCRAFNEGMDLHSYTAAVVFKVPYEKLMKEIKTNKEYKIYRLRAKNLNFGIVYGIGAKRFAKNADISEQEAEKIIRDYFNLYKGLYEWLQWAKKQAVIFKESRSLGGRLFKHKFDEDNFGQVALAERNGCNFPIQATNADMTKRAMKLIYDECHSYAKIINCVHDEIVLECPDEYAEKCKEAVERLMIQAGEYYIKRVPVLVDCVIQARWAK